MASEAGHVFEEHPSEVAVRVVAPNLPALFVEAGRALAEVMAGGVPPPATSAPERVTLRAHDREALLVDWLNELVYRAETGRFVPCEFSVERLEGGELDATVRGTASDNVRPLVKAASFHGLRITCDDDGCAATVVLDV